MMNPKPLLTLLMIFLFFSAKSEIIDGPANFRLKPKGKILVSLTDGVHVECSQLENGWFNVSFTISLTKQQFEKGYEIKMGEKLFDDKNKLIGVAVANIPSSSTSPHTSGGAPGNPAVYWMEIIGYISKSNIKEGSIPENTFDILIDRNRTALKFDNLRNYIFENKYEKDDLLKKFYPKLKAFSISESAVGGGSALDRITLVFENDELIAIIHSRHLKIENIKDYDLLYGNKIIIFRPPTGENLNSFLKKNKAAYSGTN